MFQPDPLDKSGQSANETFGLTYQHTLRQTWRAAWRSPNYITWLIKMGNPIKSWSSNGNMGKYGKLRENWLLGKSSNYSWGIFQQTMCDCQRVKNGSQWVVKLFALLCSVWWERGWEYAELHSYAEKGLHAKSWITWCLNHHSCICSQSIPINSCVCTWCPE